MGDELGRFGCGEVESEHADVDRDRLDGIGSGDKDAGVVVNGFDYADGGIDPIEDLRGWRVDGDAARRPTATATASSSSRSSGGSFAPTPSR
jgi:hypothetical protein